MSKRVIVKKQSRENHNHINLSLEINKVKLKSCPFCGTKPVFYYLTEISTTSFYTWFICCPKCQIKQSSSFPKGAVIKWNKCMQCRIQQQYSILRESVIEKWNNRVRGKKFNIEVPE